MGEALFTHGQVSHLGRFIATVGLWAALELAFWQLNFDLPYLTFGRIRPLHTNAVIPQSPSAPIFGAVSLTSTSS